MTTFDIATFGSITLDTFIEPKEMRIFSADDKNYFGFEIGQKIPTKTTAKHVGGGSANSAVGFAKAGLRVTALGTIGFDDHGQYILHQLEKKHVDLQHISIQSQTPSASSIIIMQKGSDRTVFNERTTCVPFPTIPDTKAIYSSHLTDCEAVIFNDIVRWKKKNPQKIFAWNPGKTQFNEGFDAFKKLLPLTDVLILNVEEAILFTGIDAPKIPKKNFFLPILTCEENCPHELRDLTRIKDKFLNAGVKHLIVTDGKSGSQYFSKAKNFLLPLVDTTPPVNTLGAGDSFSVGAVSALLRNESPEKMMLAGSINASSVVQHFGAQNGLLSSQQIERSIDNFVLL